MENCIDKDVHYKNIEQESSEHFYTTFMENLKTKSNEFMDCVTQSKGSPVDAIENCFDNVLLSQDIRSVINTYKEREKQKLEREFKQFKKLDVLQKSIFGFGS